MRTLKLPSPNVTAETHTVYLSYKGACCPAVLPGNSLLKLAVKETKLYENLTVRMWPAAITLNYIYDYSVENIQNNICQKIIIKIPIRLTSVWLTHAHPNKVAMGD